MLIVSFIIVIGLLVILTAFSIVRTNKYENVVSFRESMDLTGFPIITFYIGDKKLNFLLDTGSNESFIDFTAVKTIKHELLDKYTEVKGVGDTGNTEYRYCRINFFYKTKKFSSDFCIIDLSPTFTDIKNASGVNIHGLLGSKFFQKYKYVINFDELIAYSKK